MLSDAEHQELEAALRELADFDDRAEVISMLGGPIRSCNLMAVAWAQMAFYVEWMVYAQTHETILLPGGSQLLGFVLVIVMAALAGWGLWSAAVSWVNLRRTRARAKVTALRRMMELPPMPWQPAG